MDRRKLQKTGGSSLTLTLPKKWTELHGLKDKDSVLMHVLRSGVLALWPSEKRVGILTPHLTIDDMNKDTLIRELLACYINGADKIQLHAAEISAEQRMLVREIANRLMVGFEITGESGKKIVLRSVLDAKKFPVQKTIEKMFDLTRTMVDDAGSASSSYNKQLAKDVIDRDAEINKWKLAIKRQNYMLAHNPLAETADGLGVAELNYYEFIATQLERIADHAVRIMRVVNLADTNIQQVHTQRFGESLRHVLSLLQETKEMVLSVDKERAHVILKHRTPETQDAYLMKLMKNTQDPHSIIIGGSIDRWMGYIANIAERTIDQYVMLHSKELTKKEKN